MAIALVCSPELDVKVLLPRAAQTLITEYGKIKLLLASNIFFFLLASLHST